MSPADRQLPKFLSLQLPVIVMVLAFTVIPLQWRWPDAGSLAEAFQVHFGFEDIVENIVGYIPVGVVLASLGTWWALVAATALSIVAELSQLVSLGRTPGVMDVAANFTGAIIGVALCARWKTHWMISPPRVRIDRWAGFLAAALALVYIGVAHLVLPHVGQEARLASVALLKKNDRGSSKNGILEAHWTFDGGHGTVVRDASGNGLDGVLVNEPKFVTGVVGRALQLNGVNQYADFGDPIALRLAGSMTISAWINSRSFPVDDAAIVSNHGDFGYQLDTTVDQGQRTIGFKLTNAAGQLMARYGKTPLVTGRWYHVTGVYNAAAKTLNVYLNGELDNGCLVGDVTGRQRISGLNLYVGRRGNADGFEFAGLIDDVKIYSRALTQNEIETQAGGAISTSLASRAINTPANGNVTRPDASDKACQSIEDGADARVNGLIVALGLLVGVACAGLWPTGSYRWPSLLASFASGFLLHSTDVPGLPMQEHWIIPLLTLLGGLTAVASIRTCTADKPHVHA